MKTRIIADLTAMVDLAHKYSELADAPIPIEKFYENLIKCKMQSDSSIQQRFVTEETPTTYNSSKRARIRI